MTDDMDINGDILRPGGQRRRHGPRNPRQVLRVTSGERTKSEALGLGDNEFVPSQVGAVM